MIRTKNIIHIKMQLLKQVDRDCFFPKASRDSGCLHLAVLERCLDSGGAVQGGLHHSDILKLYAQKCSPFMKSYAFHLGWIDEQAEGLFKMPA